LSQTEWNLVERAVVVWANHYQFAPAERIGFPSVRSRNLVWCVRGSGQVVGNGQRIEMTAGAFLLLPWQHSIVYRAAQREPFVVGGLHVIPFHDRRRPVVFHVAHGPERDLWHAKYRRDVSLPALGAVVAGDFAEHPALGHLAEYAVACFARSQHAGQQDEVEMRRLGRLALLEFIKSARQADACRELPPLLLRISDWVHRNLDRPISLDQLAELGECSRSTVQRMMRRHFNQSALEWTIQVKLSRAKSLLASTKLPVSRVAQQVGFSDPYYFSRLFTSKVGESPRQYRARGRLLG
jgi:AraC-like DNA-binding protein